MYIRPAAKHTHLRRLRRLRALGVRSNVPDVSPVVDARERRDARGMRDELGVENSSWGETARSLAAREMGERRKETASGKAVYGNLMSGLGIGMETMRRN